MKEKLVIKVKTNGHIKIRCAPLKCGEIFNSEKDYTRKPKYKKDLLDEN